MSLVKLSFITNITVTLWMGHKNLWMGHHIGSLIVGYAPDTVVIAATSLALQLTQYCGARYTTKIIIPYDYDNTQ